MEEKSAMREALTRHESGHAYASNGYALLKQLFRPIVLSVFHGKMQADLNLKGNPSFVSRTPLLTKPALEVYSQHYVPMATFHWGLTPAIAGIAGCELIPTYAYFRVYQQGDVCRVHSDREACEHSLSLVIELSDTRPWALCIGRALVEERPAPAGPDFGTEAYASLPMSAGDAVIYRGVDHRHGRLEPNPEPLVGASVHALGRCGGALCRSCVRPRHARETRPADVTEDLRLARSILFLPASNPRAIAKAREAGSDLVVLDLEDAVKREDKDAARDAAVEAVGSAWSMPVAIRVNGVGTEWHSLDIDAVARSKTDLVVLPRAISGHLVHEVAEAVSKPVLAMIETAAGVLAAAGIAGEAAGLIAGTNDLRSDLRLPLDANREPISASLQMIVLAARASGVAVFDGVFNRLDDPDGFLGEAENGRGLGFDGKSLDPPGSDRAVPPRIRAPGGRARPRTAADRSIWRRRRAVRE